MKVRLRKLSLDKIGISDAKVKDIMGWIEESETLKSISLSENKLSDAIVESVSKVIQNNSLIEEVYLSWNNITSVGAEPLFKSLSKSLNVTVFDIGWNSIGANMKVVKKNAEAAVDAICNCITTNTRLAHLNLCNNGFGFEDSKKIAEVSSKIIKRP